MNLPGNAQKQSWKGRIAFRVGWKALEGGDLELGEDLGRQRGAGEGSRWEGWCESRQRGAGEGSRWEGPVR